MQKKKKKSINFSVTALSHEDNHTADVKTFRLSGRLSGLRHQK